MERTSNAVTRLAKIKAEFEASFELNALKKLEAWTQTQPLAELERIGLAISAYQARLEPYFPYVLVQIPIPPGKIFHELIRVGARVHLMIQGDSDPTLGIVSGLQISQISLGFNAPYENITQKCKNKTVHVRWAREYDDLDTFGEINKESPLLKSVVDFLVSPATARANNKPCPMSPSLGRVLTDLSLSQVNILKSIHNSMAPFTLVEAPFGVGRRRIISGLLETLMKDGKNRVMVVSSCQHMLDDVSMRLEKTNFWNRIVRTGELPGLDYLTEESWKKLQSLTLQVRVQPLTQDDPNKAAGASIQILNEGSLFFNYCDPQVACELQELILAGGLRPFTHLVIDEVYSVPLFRMMHYLPLAEKAIFFSGTQEDPTYRGQNGSTGFNIAKFSSESTSLTHQLLQAYKSADQELKDDIAGNYMVRAAQVLDIPAPLFELDTRIYGTTWMRIDGSIVTDRPPLPTHPNCMFDLSQPVLWIDVPPEKNPSRLTSERVNVLEADILLHVLRHLRTLFPQLQPQIVSGTVAQNALVTKALSQWLGTPAHVPLVDSLSPVSLDGLVGAPRAELIIFSSGNCRAIKPLQGYGVLGQKVRKCLIILADSELAKSGNYGQFMQGALNLAESVGGLYWIDPQRDLKRNSGGMNASVNNPPSMNVPEYISSLRLDPDQISTFMDMPLGLIAPPTDRILAGLEDPMEIRNSGVNRPIPNPMHFVREDLPERSETRLPPMNSNMTFGGQNPPARAAFMHASDAPTQTRISPQPEAPVRHQQPVNADFEARYPTLPRHVLARISDNQQWMLFLRQRFDLRTDELVEALLEEPALEELVALVFENMDGFEVRPAAAAQPAPADEHVQFDFPEGQRDQLRNDPDQIPEPPRPVLDIPEIADYPAAPDEDPNVQEQIDAFLAHYDEFCTPQDLEVIRRHLPFVSYYIKRGDAYQQIDMLEDDRLYDKNDLLEVLLRIFDRRENDNKVESILHPVVREPPTNQAAQREQLQVIEEREPRQENPGSLAASDYNEPDNQSLNQTASDDRSEDANEPDEDKKDLNEMLFIGQSRPSSTSIPELRAQLEELQGTFDYIEDSDIQIMLEFPTHAQELCKLSPRDWAKYRDENNIKWQRCISRIMDEYENRKKAESRKHLMGASRIYNDQPQVELNPPKPNSRTEGNMLDDEIRLPAAPATSIQRTTSGGSNMAPANQWSATAIPPASVQLQNPFEQAPVLQPPPPYWQANLGSQTINQGPDHTYLPVSVESQSREAPWQSVFVPPTRPWSPFDDDSNVQQDFPAPVLQNHPFSDDPTPSSNPFADPEPQPKPSNANPFED